MSVDGIMMTVWLLLSLVSVSMMLLAFETCNIVSVGAFQSMYG